MLIHEQLLHFHEIQHTIVHFPNDPDILCTHGENPTILFFKNSQQDVYIEVSSKLYIKFPDKYCLLRNGNSVQISTSNREFVYENRDVYAAWGNFNFSENTFQTSYVSKLRIEHAPGWRKFLECTTG